MKALHPKILVIAGVLVLVGASTVGPDSTLTKPAAVRVSPLMTCDGSRMELDDFQPAISMTQTPLWKTDFPSYSGKISTRQVSNVTAAPDRLPFQQSDDRDNRARTRKQPAMLSPIVRLKTAGDRTVRVGSDVRPPALQRMMKPNAASVA